MTRGSIAQYDCVVIVTDHKAFDYKALVEEADVIVDTRNAIKEPHPNVFKLGAPRAAAAPEGDKVVDRVTRDALAFGHDRTVLDLGADRRLRLCGLPLPAGSVGPHRGPPAAAAPRSRTARWPSISIIIAARNEARAAAGARRATCSIRTIPGRCEIIVVSDGSTDAPGRALAPFGAAVRLIEVPAGGKPLALNAGVAASTGDILVFADARQRFAPRRADRAGRELRGSRRSAASPASWCSTASGPARPTPRSAKASASTGSTRSGCAATRAACGRCSARPAPSTRCAARAGPPLPAGDAARRRAGADARGAERLPRRLRGPRRSPTTARRPMPRPNRAARRARSPATTRSSRRSRGCWCRWSTRSGCSTCRTRSAAWWCRGRWSGLFVSTLALARGNGLYAPVLFAQGVFYGLALAGALFQARERFGRIAFTFVMMNIVGRRRTGGAAARPRGVAVMERLAFGGSSEQSRAAGTAASKRPAAPVASPPSPSDRRRVGETPRSRGAPRLGVHVDAASSPPMLFLRPQDIIAPLGALHLAELSAHRRADRALHRPAVAAAADHADDAGIRRRARLRRGDPPDRAVLDLDRRIASASSRSVRQGHPRLPARGQRDRRRRSARAADVGAGPRRSATWDSAPCFDYARGVEPDRARHARRRGRSAGSCRTRTTWR